MVGSEAGFETLVTRVRVPLEDLSKHEMSKAMASRLKADRKCIATCLQKMDWYVSHCKRDLQDMGIVDGQGKTVVDLDTITSPPLQKSPTVNKVKTDEDDAVGTVGEALPYGKEFKSLHRNFGSWRSVPPGWKRRLLSDEEDIALSMQATKIMVPTGAREPPASPTALIGVAAVSIPQSPQSPQDQVCLLLLLLKCFRS